MKTLLSILVFLVAFTATAQKSINWQPDINKALAKAKAENKLLFVEAYLPTCPACQALEPFLKDDQVAENYNANFINYKLDLGPIDGARKFLDERNIYIPSYPQFLFFDGEGNLVHQSEVYPNVESIISVKNDALNPEARTSNFKNRFEKGDRTQDFLVKYGVYSQFMKDTATNHLVGNALFEHFDKEKLGQANSWAILKKVITTTDNGFFKYWIENIPTAAALETQFGHPGQENNTYGRIIQTTIFDPASKLFSSQKVNELKGYMEKIGAGQYANDYLWEHELLANIRENNLPKALEVAERTYKVAIPNGNFAVYVTKVLNDNFSNNSYISLAKQSMINAEPNIKTDDVKMEAFYENARFENKLGNKDLAKKQANDALELAKKNNKPSEKYQNFINTL